MSPPIIIVSRPAAMHVVLTNKVGMIARMDTQRVVSSPWSPHEVNVLWVIVYTTVVGTIIAETRTTGILQS